MDEVPPSASRRRDSYHDHPAETVADGGVMQGVGVDAVEAGRAVGTRVGAVFDEFQRKAAPWACE